MTQPRAADLTPYVLPEGNVQVAFSMGRSSGYMLHQIAEANGGIPDRVEIITTNTGREFEQSLEFYSEVCHRWGLKITLLEYASRTKGNEVEHGFRKVCFDTASRDGEPFKDVMRYFGYPPNREADFCSHELKTRTARRYCVEVLRWDHWTTAIGIRADEKSRALKEQPRERYRVWYPMLQAGVTKHDVAMFWRKQPFDLKLPNVKGRTPLGNCDGCFKKSQANRAALARDFPDRAAWWAEQEDRFGGTFLPNTSWRAEIDFISKQGDWIFSEEATAAGVLCQADDGECFG